MKKYLRTTFNPRQYMLSKDFELYYYDDTHMSKQKNHTHDYYEFYFFLGGEASIEINGVSYELTPGDMVLIPPLIKHPAYCFLDYQRILQPTHAAFPGLRISHAACFYFQTICKPF